MSKMKNVATLISELEHICSIHDWDYFYSNDHRVWLKGRETADTIHVICRELDEIGFGDKANEIVEKHLPKKG